MRSFVRFQKPIEGFLLGVQTGARGTGQRGQLQENDVADVANGRLAASQGSRRSRAVARHAASRAAAAAAESLSSPSSSSSSQQSSSAAAATAALGSPQVAQRGRSSSSARGEAAAHGGHRGRQAAAAPRARQQEVSNRRREIPYEREQQQRQSRGPPSSPSSSSLPGEKVHYGEETRLRAAAAATQGEIVAAERGSPQRPEQAAGAGTSEVGSELRAPTSN